MTVIWLSDDGLYSVDNGTVSALTPPWREFTWVSLEPVRQPMQFVLDDLRRALAKARAPIAILVAAIRDTVRCVPRLAVALPGPQCSSSIRRRPRRRDIRHGDALLNVHRMPA